MGWHQRLIDAGEGWYRRWRAKHSRADGKPRHGRNVHWWGTKVPRVAARFFPEIVWRLPRERDDVDSVSSGRDDLPSTKSLALTFDDGPSPDQTPRVLEQLDRHGVRATFFLVGAQAERHPELVREIVARGHAIGNHTWSHLDAWMHDFPVVADELARTDDLLAELTAARPVWVRPPHGHFTAKLRVWCAERGQQVVMWDTLPGDFVEWATPEALTAFTLRQVREGSIVVLHDGPGMAWGADALPQLLPRLRDEGWALREVKSQKEQVNSEGVGRA